MEKGNRRENLENHLQNFGQQKAREVFEGTDGRGLFQQPEIPEVLDLLLPFIDRGCSKIAAPIATMLASNRPIEGPLSSNNPVPRHLCKVAFIFQLWISPTVHCACHKE